MTPDVGELLSWAGINHIMDVLLLASWANVFTVKMIDMIEFQALGAVSGHEADGAAGGFEDMLGIGNGLPKGFAVTGENSHTLGSIFGGFVVKRITLSFPVVDGIEGLGLGVGFIAKFR